MNLPTVIQGGMGAGVSCWKLAQAVSRKGQLGVVAGTALDVILVRRLQMGDPGEHMRRALEQFPIESVKQWILDRYFISGGKAPDEPFRSLPLVGENMSRERSELTVAANFVEVMLAREGHDNPVGVNYLEKIQFPTLPSLFGAMLAGVEFVLMGAGIPLAIPGILDSLAAGKAVELSLDVAGGEEKSTLEFDPAPYLPNGADALVRPKFLGIVSSNTVATVLIRKGSGKTDGLIIEGAQAGGHNAPPRGKLQVNENGEPIYSDRDVPNLPGIAKLGVPFWMAGYYASPERLSEALEAGATGIQVGTAFAFTEESGLDPELRKRAHTAILSEDVNVFTDPLASPTGFPFKVLELQGTLSDRDINAKRPRVCDLGYLRQAYRKDDGSVGWRCPSEPVKLFEGKGGSAEATVGRKCVCNGLLANIGMPQPRKSGEVELPLLTCGDDLAVVKSLLEANPGGYHAEHVLELLLGSGIST